MGKKLSLVGIALVGFLGPLEYSVVMPSLWFYLKEFGIESQVFYSITLSAFSFAHMLGSPLVGWLVDRRPMKELLCIGMLISAIGHGFYAMAWNEWIVMMGRLIAGLGAANFTLVGVYVAKITTLENRTTVTARLNIFMEMGLLLGPAFAVLFEMFDYSWGPFDVNEYTSPGYLMCLCCLVLMLYLLFFFENPVSIAEEKAKAEDAKPTRISSRNSSRDADAINGSVNSPSDDSSSVLSEDDMKDNLLARSIDSLKSAAPEKSAFSRIFTRATITVFFAQFILFFNQTSTEAIVAPLTERYYDFTPFENSLIFVGITVVFLIMYFVISLISQHVQDRTLIAAGIALEFISLTMSFLIFLLIDEPPFWLFLIGVSFFVVGLPFFFCCTSSLLTKLVDEKDVGTASGILSSSMNLANIMGPLWGGTFEVEPWLPFVGALGLVTLLGLVFTFSFKSLYIPKEGEKEKAKRKSRNVAKRRSKETSPLIS